MNNNTNWIWSIVGIVVVAVIVYLAVTAAVNIFWIFGGGLIGLIVLLIVLGVLSNGIGLGTIFTILVIFLLLELFL